MRCTTAAVALGLLLLCACMGPSLQQDAGENAGVGPAKADAGKVSEADAGGGATAPAAKADAGSKAAVEEADAGGGVEAPAAKADAGGKAAVEEADEKPGKQAAAAEKAEAEPEAAAKAPSKEAAPDEYKAPAKRAKAPPDEEQREIEDEVGTAGGAPAKAAALAKGSATTDDAPAPAKKAATKEQEIAAEAATTEDAPAPATKKTAVEEDVPVEKEAPAAAKEEAAAADEAPSQPKAAAAKEEAAAAKEEAPAAKEEAAAAKEDAPAAKEKAAAAKEEAPAAKEEAAAVKEEAPAPKDEAAAAKEEAPAAKEEAAPAKEEAPAAKDEAAAAVEAPAQPKKAAAEEDALSPAEDGTPSSKKAAAADDEAAAKPASSKAAASEGISADGLGGPTGHEKPPPAKIRIVEVAPEAEIENNDDIGFDGKCQDFIAASSCKDVTLGEGRLAECVSQLIAAVEASADDPGQEAEPVPEACEEEVYNFYINRSKNINLNVPLAKACKVDAERVCNNTWFFGPTEGRVIACLRDSKDKVSSSCKVQLFKLQRAAARDYRADPAIREYCKADVERLCGKDVKEGGGRKQACLRDNQLKLSWECAEQLFRQELEADDDIRLSVRLYQRCLGDKKRFCADVEPGQAEAKDCLLEHRNANGFSAACRDELEAMVERRVRDFRIDSRLRRNCQQDIMSLCGMLDSLGGDEADVNICLQDYVNEIRDDKCKSLVRQYQGLASQDIRFDVPLADACFEDRMKLCAKVPPGSARVIRCLQSQRAALAPGCRATLFDQEVAFSENIDFQYPMKQACAKEIALFCAKVPHGNGRVIRCLQENKGRRDFGKPCHDEVASYEQRASQDYRLNFRLRTACRGDVDALCKDVCPSGRTGGDLTDGEQVCGGTVLRCLTQKADDIRSEACRKEVFYFMRMEVQDFHNDVILAAACREDVEKFCKDVKPGAPGATHECLRKRRADISDACRREQLILEQAEAETVELRPKLLRSCSSERQLFCKDVRPGNARVFRCLADKLADPDFGPVCRGEVIAKVQRRQANWRLDPPLRKACRADVAKTCASEDQQASESGLVYKCLIANFADADAGCRRELGRALHMAFFVWIPGSILTHACDVDISSVCLQERPNMLHQPGQVATCLAEALEKIAASEAAGRKDLREAAAATPPPRLSPECRALVEVAAPPNAKRAFEESLSAALLESQLAALESKAGVPLVARDAKGQAQGLTLTGWTAVLGIAAAVVTLLAGAAYALRRYLGIGDGSTLVLKARGGYKRVDTAAS